MKVKQKATGRAATIPGGLAAGACVNMIVTGSGAALLAYLLHTEKIQWEGIGYGIMFMLLAASFLGTLMANFKIKRRRFMVSALSAGVYLAILLSVTALFFGGQYEAVGVTALLITGGSMTAWLLGAREKKGIKHKKLKTVHR